MDDLVIVARHLKARGIRGEVLVEGFGQPPQRFRDLREVWLRKAGGEAQGPMAVTSVTGYRGGWILRIDGIPDRTAAEAWNGAEVCVPRDERPALEDGQIYLADLLGATVVDQASGDVLGVVEAWQDYGGPPVLVVGKMEIPLARSICVDIDVAAGRIVVNLPEGLKELNA